MTFTRYAPPGLGSSVISEPIQRSIFAGSTRNSHTVCGLASISTVRSTAVSVVVSILLPLLHLGLPLERGEAITPELLEELLQLVEPFGPGPVEPSRPVASLVHEPRLLQDCQMLRDGRPRHLEVPGDLARGQLFVADEGQDLPPSRL